jgi:hypothetical protein
VPSFEEITKDEFTARKESGRPLERDDTLFARLGCVSCPNHVFLKSEEATRLERKAVSKATDQVQVSSLLLHDVLTIAEGYSCEQDNQGCPNEAGLATAKEMLLEQM